MKSFLSMDILISGDFWWQLCEEILIEFGIITLMLLSFEEESLSDIQELIFRKLKDI